MFSFVPNPALKDSLKRQEIQQSLEIAELEESLNTVDLARSGSYSPKKPINKDAKSNWSGCQSVSVVRYRRQDNMNSTSASSDEDVGSLKSSVVSKKQRKRFGFSFLRKARSSWSVAGSSEQDSRSSLVGTLPTLEGFHSDSEISTTSVRTAIRRTTSRTTAPSEQGQGETPHVSDLDIATRICNSFWRPSLSFHQYRHGDKTIKFSDIWPEDRILLGLIQDAYKKTVLRGSVIDLCKLSLRCGPLRALKILRNQRIVDFDLQLKNGSTLLHVATIAQNYDAVLYLLSQGISPKAKDFSGLMAEDVCFCPKILKLLSSYHRPGYIPSKGSQRRKLISIQPVTTADREFIFTAVTDPASFDELLLRIQSVNFDVNSESNGEGNYLVHIAISGGLVHVPLLLCLVRIFQADIEKANKDGMTPLMIACQEGSAVVVDLIMCVLGANPNSRNQQNGRCGLHYAALNNHIDVINALLKRGADCNLEDDNGSYADKLAYIHGYNDCTEIIQSNRTMRTQMLMENLKMGPLAETDLRLTDFYTVDNEGFNLIMAAAICNRTESLKILLKVKDCPLNAQHYKSGRTALSMAARAGHLEIVRLLLVLKANPAIRDIEGLLPLHYAVKNNHSKITDLLLQDNRTLTGLTLAKRLSVDIALNEKMKDAINRRQSDYVTPQLLQYAVTGNAEKLYCLLEDGDDVNPVSGVGNWPLYLAAENALDSPEDGHLAVIKILYERGANLSHQHPTTGNTVLHIACARNQYYIVKFLLHSLRHQEKATSPRRSSLITSKNHSVSLTLAKKRKQLKLNAVNKEGKGALQIAADKGYSKIVKCLLDAGVTTAIVNSQGGMYSCLDYQGVQVLIEQQREKHTREVIRCIEMRRGGLMELQLIWQAPHDHNLRTVTGDTPLMVAARRGRPDRVHFMVKSAVYRTNLPQNISIIESDEELETDLGGDLLQDPTIRRSASTYPDIPPEYALEVTSGEIGEDSIDQSEDELLMSLKDSKYNSIAGHEFRTSTPKPLTPLSVKNSPSANLKLTINGKSPKGSSISPRRSSEPPSFSGSSARRQLDFAKLEGPPGGPPVRPISDQPEYEPHNEAQEGSDRTEHFVSNTQLHSSSIFSQDNHVSHVCATNPNDGCTALHQAIEGGDSVEIVTSLLDADLYCANIQNHQGLSPLHLACKLGRRNIVNKLTSCHYVDTNLRTRDGKLAEEMTSKRSLIAMVTACRQLQPRRKSSYEFSLTPPSSLFSRRNTNMSIGGSSINFDQLHDRFEEIKNNDPRRDPQIT